MFYTDILKFVLNVQSENILYKACAAAQNFIWNFKIPDEVLCSSTSLVKDIFRLHIKYEF